MNQTMKNQQNEKQGILGRMFKAVLKKTFGWFCQYPLGTGSPETMMFMNYSGLGIEDALTYQSISLLRQTQLTGVKKQ